VPTHYDSAAMPKRKKLTRIFTPRKRRIQNDSELLLLRFRIIPVGEILKIYEECDQSYKKNSEGIGYVG